MYYKIFFNNKLVHTAYNLSQVEKYIKNHHPMRGTGIKALKKNFKIIPLFEESIKSIKYDERGQSLGEQEEIILLTDVKVFTKREENKGEIKVLEVEDIKNEEGIITQVLESRKRTIPKNIRNIIKNSEEETIYGRFEEYEYKKIINVTYLNYISFTKKIIELIKEKGSDFLETNKIKVILYSKSETLENDEQIDTSENIGTHFTDFNNLYQLLIEKIENFFNDYNGRSMEVKKVTIEYIEVPPLDQLYIYRGEEDEEIDIMDDLMHRMKFNDKKKVLDLLNKYFIWSPSTNKNCFIKACLMSRFQHKEVDNKCRDFIRKKINFEYKLESMGPVMANYLKCNINVVYLDTNIKEFKYNYNNDKDTEIINVMIKGTHAFGMVNKNTPFNEEDKPEEEQIKIEVPIYKNELKYYTIATFDLETHDEEENDLNKKDTEVYALGYYNGKKYKEIYKDGRILKNILNEFLKFLYKSERGNKVIYAHNGGKFDTYLLIKEILTSNLFTITSFLDSNGRILNLSIVQNKEKGKKFIIRDSINLIACSLDKACQDFKPKTRKLEGDVDHNKINSSNGHTKEIYEYTRKYLKNDCISLYEILSMYNKTITKNYGFGIKDVMTNASIARRVFLTKYYKSVEKPLYKLTSDIDRKLRKYYFGGRNECMGKLGYRKGKFYYVDFTSLYPYVMMLYKYFYGKMNKINVNTTEFNNDWFGFAKVLFRNTNKNNIPLHPVLINNKLIFPHVDNWTESIISTEEIRYSIENNLGYEYKFIEIYNWEQKDYLFKDITNKLYKMKLSAQKSGNQALRSISKITINSLYGFFGINFLERVQTKIINERATKYKTKEQAQIARFYSYLLCQKLNDYKEYGIYDVYQITDRIKSKCANVGIASMVTSYARIELYKLLKAIKDNGGSIEYMDTDSVITDLNIYELDEFKTFIGSGGENLGELTNECDDEVKKVLKKMYIKKIIKEENLNIINDDEKIEKIFKDKYKNKINEYMKTKTFYFKELIKLGNKMYALRTDFKYEGEIYEVKILKMKGINSKLKYNIKEIDDENKIIYYKNIDKMEGMKFIDFDDYKLLSEGYKLICDNMNFISGVKEMIIKDKGLIKLNNTKCIRKLYDKANVDDDGNISPLII